MKINLEDLKLNPMFEYLYTEVDSQTLRFLELDMDEKIYKFIDVKEDLNQDLSGYTFLSLEIFEACLIGLLQKGFSEVK